MNIPLLKTVLDDPWCRWRIWGVLQDTWQLKWRSAHFTCLPLNPLRQAADLPFHLNLCDSQGLKTTSSSSQLQQWRPGCGQSCAHLRTMLCEVFLVRTSSIFLLCIIYFRWFLSFFWPLAQNKIASMTQKPNSFSLHTTVKELCTTWKFANLVKHG